LEEILSPGVFGHLDDTRGHVLSGGEQGREVRSRGTSPKGLARMMKEEARDVKEESKRRKELEEDERRQK
jgi:hypothetical protein